MMAAAGPIWRPARRFAQSRPAFGIFDLSFANPRLAGWGRVGLADFTAAAHLSCLDYTGDVPELYSVVRDFYARIKSRPSFARFWPTMWPACARRPITPIWTLTMSAQAR